MSVQTCEAAYSLVAEQLLCRGELLRRAVRTRLSAQSNHNLLPYCAGVWVAEASGIIGASSIPFAV